jgi:hypothetical protein
MSRPYFKDKLGDDGQEVKIPKLYHDPLGIIFHLWNETMVINSTSAYSI